MSAGQCLSYGIDFVDGGSYFINTLSNESFTSVSQFSGCSGGTADIALIDPNGDEYYCDSVPVLPDYTSQLSSWYFVYSLVIQILTLCSPIYKSSMFSGDYMLLIFGNNADADPFAYERDFYLDCGPQVTSTIIPTVTWSITETPSTTFTTTSVDTTTLTADPVTVTSPSKTAKRTKTVTPSPVTRWITKTYTRLRYTWTKSLKVVTKTVIASCTIPTTRPRDPTCTYTPTGFTIPALATGSVRQRRADRAVDIAYARRRINAARARRNLPPLRERAPDEPIVTETASPPVNVTTTFTDPTVSYTETALTTTTAITTPPPVTVYSGVYKSTVTAPTPTETKYTYTKVTRWKTKTIFATWTYKTTVTPTSVIKTCRKKGGYIEGLRL